MTLTTEQLDKLTREDLLALVIRQQEIIALLQAERTSVIHRKVTNCFRSEWGAKAYAALQSVIATARLKGENIFDALVKLMGKPIGRYLQPSSP